MQRKNALYWTEMWNWKKMSNSKTWRTINTTICQEKCVNVNDFHFLWCGSSGVFLSEMDEYRSDRKVLRTLSHFRHHSHHAKHSGWECCFPNHVTDISADPELCNMDRVSIAMANNWVSRIYKAANTSCFGWSSCRTLNAHAIRRSERNGHCCFFRCFYSAEKNDLTQCYCWLDRTAVSGDGTAST